MAAVSFKVVTIPSVCNDARGRWTWHHAARRCIESDRGAIRWVPPWG